MLLVCALFLLANILLDVFLLGTFRRAQQVYEAQRQVQEAENLLKAQSEYYHQLQGSAAALKGLQSEMVETLAAHVPGAFPAALRQCTPGAFGLSERRGADRPLPLYRKRRGGCGVGGKVPAVPPRRASP